jgi:hypothetical protein
MHLDVTIQLMDDGGNPVWAYSLMEAVPVDSTDAEGNGLRLAQALLQRVEEGKESLERQIKADLAGGRLSASQADVPDCSDCGHSVLLHAGESGPCGAKPHRFSQDGCACERFAA